MRVEGPIFFQRKALALHFEYAVKGMGALYLGEPLPGFFLILREIQVGLELNLNVAAETLDFILPCALIAYLRELSWVYLQAF